MPPVLDYEIEIVTAMQNMANTVIANAASRSLAKYVLALLRSEVLKVHP
jgi:large subunit ribosomal protein L17e